jgi:hypothetical protein
MHLGKFLQDDPFALYEMWLKPLGAAGTRADILGVNAVERLYVVEVQLDLLASIRRLGPPSPELEWASTALCEQEDELLQELLWASIYQRAARGRCGRKGGCSPAPEMVAHRPAQPGPDGPTEETARQVSVAEVSWEDPIPKLFWRVQSLSGQLGERVVLGECKS